MVAGLFFGAAAGMRSAYRAAQRWPDYVIRAQIIRIVVEENPLHPFELHDLVPPISLGGLDISITKAVVMMWVVVALVTVLMVKASSSSKLVPSKLQNMAEMVAEFIRDIILDTMGQKGMRFFPLVATLFLFILFCNLIGLDSRIVYRDQSDRR